MRETLQRAQEVYHACARTRDYAHGIETLGALLEEGGDTAQVLHLRASLYTMAGDPVRALEDLDAAVAAGPVWGGLYYDRGALHHGAGNHRRALSDLSEAVLMAHEAGDEDLIDAAEHIVIAVFEAMRA